MRKLVASGCVLAFVCVAIAACDPDGGAHTNNAAVSSTCTVQRQHRRVSTAPSRYEGSTVDVHGTGSTCHAVLAAYVARVSGVAGGNTYWTSWVWGHPAQSQISGVTGSALSEHQYCPNWADCIYGNA